MRNICGQDGELRQNCRYANASKNCQHFTFHRYDGPPIPISDSPSIERNYKELCPQLFKGSDFIHIIHF